MKLNVAEACVMFFALVLWSCVFSVAVLLGILLMPLMVVLLLVVAIRELFRWKQSSKNGKKKTVLQRELQAGAIVINHRFGPRQKAA